VVAPDTVTLDSVAPWIIPAPERINSNPTLGDMIGAFKSLVFTVYLDWIQANDPTRQAKFWQRNYYEHIIRNERELHAIRRYIRDNPAQWALDRDNPLNFRHMSPPRRVEDYLADIQALLEDGDGE
jgi:putative transposase